MNGDRERMREIFDQARRLPASQRAAFLDTLPESDRAMRLQIDDMLAALDDAGGFMSAPTVNAPASPDTAATSVSPPREQPGTRIGPYKILQLIGEGGFGSVFMAEQEQPVRRRVALKIIKLGMDTRQVVARFEQERQALALMDHQGIAKVLDAGSTEAGRPYFVMELVKGEPIIDYCDKHTLAIPARLELFTQVCQAVQHAHTKGIIHRDIKPNNILVSTQDGRASAKVIDFGIAKATNARLTEKTLFTEHRQLIGTPEYMSPEQAEGSLDIDTRTDIYSLGVLLYELLTGSTPFDRERLRSAAFGELQRIIREVDPPAPSTRLGQSAQTLASVAAQRRTEPRKLGTIIRGELDWIVMKALEKDRQRRYESAGGLAVDVQKYLTGEEVSAAPPSVVYRLGKFARRNRTAVATGSAVAGALVLGMAAFAWQASVARDQRDRAVSAEGETKARAQELELVSNFQARMLEQVDPTRAGIELSGDCVAKLRTTLEKEMPPVPADERESRVDAFRAEWARVNTTDVSREFIDRTILRPAIALIDVDFKEKPLVQALLRQALATRYMQLGLFDAAMPLQKDAYDARRRGLGEEHRLTLQSLSSLGMVHYLTGKPGESETYITDALEKQRRTLGPAHEDTVATLGALAALRLAQSRYEESENAAREVLERHADLAGTSMSNSIAAASTLASALKSQHKLDEAETVYRETLERARRTLGEDDDHYLKLQNDLATFLQHAGRMAEAEASFRALVEPSRRLRGEDNVGTLITLGNLAFVLIEQGKLDEAEPLVLESFEGRRRVLGPDHPVTLISQFDLGRLREKQGRMVDAGDIYQDVAARRRRTLGLGHDDTLESLTELSDALLAQNKLGQATPVQRELLDASRLSVGADDPRTLGIMSVLGVILQHQDKAAEAEPVLRETLERRRRTLGPEHTDTMVSLRNMGVVLGEQDKLTESEPFFREEINARRKVQGPDHPETLAACTMLAFNLRKLGKFEELVPHAHDTAERMSRVLGQERPETLMMVEMLGTALVNQGKHAEAATVLAAREPSARSTFAGPASPRLGRHLMLLGSARATNAKAPADFSAAEANLLEASTLLAGAPGHPWVSECASAIASMYTAWDKAEPGKGHDAKAAEWSAKSGSP